MGKVVLHMVHVWIGMGGLLSPSVCEEGGGGVVCVIDAVGGGGAGVRRARFTAVVFCGEPVLGAVSMRGRLHTTIVVTARQRWGKIPGLGWRSSRSG